ncbi:MAG: rhomboid family intramembrane serine protease [Vicingaceae bacterium]
MLVKLIYANLAVFIGIQLLILPFWLMGMQLSADQFALNWLAVPSDLGNLLIKPWTVFSYMFLHIGFFHILMNMLWLYFLGQLFVEFLGEKKLWSVYVAGGLGGAALYILFYNLFPVFESSVSVSKALGASASVMAIVVAVATYAPDFSIRLLLFGNVKLKYVALVVFILDVISISNSNSGGHIAHIGGAAMGFFFAKQWRKGKDITAWVNQASAFLIAVFKPSKSKMKVKYSKSKANRKANDYTSRKKEEQNRVDEILDKISRSGYDSLSKDEKDFLFRASNNK